MKIELNETEQQYLIDSMMFYSTFMQYFTNDNRGSYSRLIKQYQYWYVIDDMFYDYQFNSIREEK